MTRHLPAARSRARSTAYSLALALATGLIAVAPVGAQDDPAAGLPAPTVTVEIPCTAPVTEEATGESYPAAAAAGETILLRFCVQPTTGYRWQDALSTNRDAVTIRGWTFAGPTDDTPGAPGTEEVLLFAEAPGTATIVTAYAQPWEGSTETPRVVEVVVTVTGTAETPTTPDRTAAGRGVRIYVLEASGDFAAVSPPWVNIQPRGSSGLLANSTFHVYWKHGTAWISVFNLADGLRATVHLKDGSVWEHRFTGERDRVTLPWGTGAIEFEAESIKENPLVRILLR